MVSRSNQSRCSGEGVLVEDPGVMNADSSRFEVGASLAERSSCEEIPGLQAAARTADFGAQQFQNPLSQLSSPQLLNPCLPNPELRVDEAESTGISRIDTASNGESDSITYYLQPRIEPAKPPPSLVEFISASPSAIRALKGPSIPLNPLPPSAASSRQAIYGAKFNGSSLDSSESADIRQHVDSATEFISPAQQSMPELASFDRQAAIDEPSDNRVSDTVEDISLEDIFRIEGQVTVMDDMQVDGSLNPSTDFSNIGEFELAALESELFDSAIDRDVAEESCEGQHITDGLEREEGEPISSTGYGPAVVKDYCAGEPDELGTPAWMEFQPSLLSEDELAVIYSESLEAMNNLLPDALEDEIVEDSVAVGSEFQLELDNVVEGRQAEEGAESVPAEGVERPAAHARFFTPPPFEETREPKCQAKPNLQRELRTEMHGLRGQIDILELREEKLSLQLGNFVNEIDQLNEQNVLLEKLVQELPDLYRKKFHDRMKPIKERIARIQEENLRLHADIDWLTQKLAANVLPPAPEERRLIKLPSFGRRLPLLPDAVGQ